jgi:hypothetical protein
MDMVVMGSSRCIFVCIIVPVSSGPWWTCGPSRHLNGVQARNQTENCDGKHSLSAYRVMLMRPVATAEPHMRVSDSRLTRQRSTHECVVVTVPNKTQQISVQPLIDTQHAFRILDTWQATLQAIPASVRSRAGKGSLGLPQGSFVSMGSWLHDSR